MVKDRFDCDCATALKALLAWWLPDRSILNVCVEEWRWSQLGGGRGEEEKGGRERERERGLERGCTSGAGVSCWARENWTAYDVFINVRNVNGRGRMKIQAGPSGSRQRRLQVVLFKKDKGPVVESPTLPPVWGKGL